MKLHKDESLFIDFIVQEGTIPDGYSAGYKILDINKNVIKKGSLAANDDNTAFLLRTKSEEIEELLSGRYTLYVFVENTDTGYKDYIYTDDLEIQDV